MNVQLSRNAHPLLKVAEWLMIVIICTIVVFAIWQLLPIDHASTGALLTFQALQAVGLFILPAVAVAYLWSDKPLQWLHLTSASPHATGDNARYAGMRLSLLSVGIIVTAIPLVNCFVTWNQSIRLPESLKTLEVLMEQMENQADMLLQRFLTYGDGVWWMLCVNLIVLAILPAIGEELTFRGVLQGLLSERAKSKTAIHIAVWVTAFVFSFIHFQFYGFVARMLLGALLGYALVWSGHIGYSMLMHATNNALSVLLFYLSTYVWHIPQETMDAIGTGQTWWLTLVCTPIMVLLLYIFYRRTHSFV